MAGFDYPQDTISAIVSSCLPHTALISLKACLRQKSIQGMYEVKETDSFNQSWRHLYEDTYHASLVSSVGSMVPPLTG